MPPTRAPLVEKYFGAIPRGPVNNPGAAAVPTLAAPKSHRDEGPRRHHHRLALLAVPGLLDRQLVALDVGGSVLGGLASSRLDNVLVRDEQIAVSASANMYALQRVGMFDVQATVKPGVDPALVEKRLDEIIAQYIANGPTADEVQRAATARSRRPRSAGSSRSAASAARPSRWPRARPLPATAISTRRRSPPMPRHPGRGPGGDAAVADPPGAVGPARAGRAPALCRGQGTPDGKVPARTTAAPPGPKRDVPPVGQLTALDFPDITHTSLGQRHRGRLRAAQRGADHPLALSFEPASPPTPPSARGVQGLMLGMLEEGTAGLDAQAIAKRRSGSGRDQRVERRSIARRDAVGAVGQSRAEPRARRRRGPASGVRARRRWPGVKAQSLTGIAQLQKDPNGIAARAAGADLRRRPSLCGAARRRCRRRSALRPATSWSRFKEQWIRPDNAKMFVVSDRPLAELLPLLNARFGTWAAPRWPRASRRSALSRRVRRRRGSCSSTVRGSPQSVIIGGQITPLDPKGDILP